MCDFIPHSMLQGIRLEQIDEEEVTMRLLDRPGAFPGSGTGQGRSRAQSLKTAGRFSSSAITAST